MALRWVLSLTDASGRLARWSLRIWEFAYEAQYRLGVKQNVTDAMSCLNINGLEEASLEYDIPWLTIYLTRNVREAKPKWKPFWMKRTTVISLLGHMIYQIYYWQWSNRSTSPAPESNSCEIKQLIGNESHCYILLGRSILCSKWTMKRI